MVAIKNLFLAGGADIPSGSADDGRAGSEVDAAVDGTGFCFGGDRKFGSGGPSNISILSFLPASYPVEEVFLWSQ